jgi:hypothetical protein
MIPQLRGRDPIRRPGDASAITPIDTTAITPIAGSHSPSRPASPHPSFDT